MAQKRQKRNSGNISIVNESISIFLFLFSNISSEISIENAMALVTKTVVVGNRHLGETKIGKVRHKMIKRLAGKILGNTNDDETEILDP